jgi:type I site-specific restriction endonuclease
VGSTLRGIRLRRIETRSTPHRIDRGANEKFRPIAGRGYAEFQFPDEFFDMIIVDEAHHSATCRMQSKREASSTLD